MIITTPGRPPAYYHRTIASVPRNPAAPTVSVSRVRFVDPATGAVQAAAMASIGGMVPALLLFN